MRPEQSYERVERESRERAAALLRSLTPSQRALVTDPAPHVSGLCPRRAGKSYAGAAAALITGEAKPGSISLIISLNLKQLKRIYWAGGPSGLFTLDRKFGLGLNFNKTECRWEHRNGSIGYLLGCEEADQREVIRGLEADLYLVDECKSIAPSVLESLIDDVIDPQRETRRGRLILIGTPGHVMAGPFYQATCERALDEDGHPFTVRPGTADDLGRTAESDLLWSHHHWTLQDNTAAPWQWDGALRKKRSKKWSDDHPTWQREYLGRWTGTTEGLVYRYFDVLPTGTASWTPTPTEANPTGLPVDDGPWHLIAGLDLGFNDPTAFVLAGYSRATGELRHVYDYSAQHMLIDDVAQLIKSSVQKYGPIERIFADVGNLGRTLVEELIKKHGLPVEKAERREKFDHIELVNNALHRGEIKVIPDTQLHNQLLTNAWALGDGTFAELARRGRLVEDHNIPNDLCDAFIYMYRGAMSRFRAPVKAPEPEYMTADWVRAWERDQLARARREESSTKLERALSVARAPHHLQRALSRNKWTTTSTN